MALTSVALGVEVALQAEARVAKWVDASDLKSEGAKSPCRFESCPGHLHRNELAIRTFRVTNAQLLRLCEDLATWSNKESSRVSLGV
jgi:hypothetical protein